VATLAAVVVAAVLIGRTSAPPLPSSNHPVVTEVRRQAVPFTPADRRRALASARLFVNTAVRREHADRAWPITTAKLHQDTTLADWKAGTLPLPPYPVGLARWKLAYAFADEVGFDVLVEPADNTVRPAVFRLTLVPARGEGTARPWLVDGWTPLGSAGGLAAANQSDVSVPTPRASARASGAWIAIPFVVLGLALLVPLLVLLGRYLFRRALRQA
jgi:hypothetical protein